MKSSIVIILLLFSGLLTAQEPLQTVKGHVLDRQTQTPLIGATIELKSSSQKRGTSTGLDGDFSFQVPLGRQDFLISYLGYQSFHQANVLVTAGKEVILQFQLEETINELATVTVSSQLNGGQINNDMALISTRSISMEELSRFAGTVNDVARMASNFAGVFIPNTQRNDIVIRGNSPIGLQWQLEDIPIANPNHFSTLGATGGVLSTINPNLLKNSDFLTGAFPAEYGNTTSGILDLGLRSGNKDQFEFTTQLAAFSGMEFIAEGPLNKKHNSSFVIAYRHSFLHLLKTFKLNIGLNSIPDYKDLSLKVDLGKNKLGKFSIFGIGGFSKINLPQTEKSSLSSSKMGTLGLSHHYLINQKAYVKSTIAFSGSMAGYKEVDLSSDIPTLAFENKDITKKLIFNTFLFTKINSRWSLKSGISSEVFFLDVNADDWQDNQHEVIRDFQGSLGLFRAYSQSQLQLSENIQIVAGLHSQYLSLNQSFALEPRVAINYYIARNQKINFGYGLHHQMQALPIYFYESEISPGQFERTNNSLGFSRSNHFVAGYDLQLPKNWSIKTNLYFQQLQNIPVDKEASYFSVLNIGADFGFPDRANLVNQGSGNNYGIELTLEKYFSKDWYSMINLSVFNSKYKGSDKINRNTAFNNGYIFNVLTGKEFRLSKKNENKFTFDIKCSTAGGRYYTPIDLVRSKQAGRTIRDYTKAYSERHLPYFRLDTKLGYRLNGKRNKFAQHFFVEFQNITNHKNPRYNYYSVSKDQVLTTHQLGFYFDLMYRIQF